MIDPEAPRTVLARGLPASPGIATGRVVLDPSEAMERADAGEAVILVRKETSPEDVQGMCAAAGILTSRGGVTSHAAVIARGMGRPCITGAVDVRIDPREPVIRIRNAIIRAGDVITIDGSSGEILEGAVDTIEPELTPEAATLLAWADQFNQ